MNSHFKVIDLEQGSKEWLEYRRRRIGASDLPVIMETPGAYQSRNELLSEKVSGFQREFSLSEQEMFRLGHEIEKQVRAEYCEHAKQVFIPVVVESLVNECFFASLDGMDLAGSEIIEVKSTRKAEYLYLASVGRCPEIWNDQIQWQLFVTGFDACVLIVVDTISDRRFSLVVSRDEKRIGELIKGAMLFLGLMRDGRAPIRQIADDDLDSTDLVAVLNQIASLESQLLVLETKKKAIAETLLNRYDASKIQNSNIIVSTLERAGAINYKSIPELSGVDLEMYRGRPIRSLRVTLRNTRGLE